MDEKNEKFRFPKQLIIIYATIFADSLGYSFVMPILPYYTELMKGTPLELGIVLSIYAFTQAISISIFNSFSLLPGCIYMGSLSDKFGRKLFIIIALFGFWTGTTLFKLHIFRFTISILCSYHLVIYYCKGIHGSIGRQFYCRSGLYSRCRSS